MNTIVWQILLQLLLIALNAVFACAEIAVISVNENKLERLSAAGDRRAGRLNRLVKQPARFLATIQVAITLSGFLGSAFAAENFSDHLASALKGIGLPLSDKVLDTLSVVLITLILSYLTLVCGELVPKRLAMKRAEQLALGMSGPITVIAHLFAPIVAVLTASTNGVLRLCGVDPEDDGQGVSEEDIRMLVDAGSQKGVIDPEEKEIIDNLFAFDDRPVAEYATHRTDLTVLFLKDTPEQWEQTIRSSLFYQYPVCGETVDDVVGILSLKAYMCLPDTRRETVMEKAVRPPFFVPETVCGDALLRQMKQSGERLAVVLDEYGGVSGILTRNDLIEQLVGDMETEEAQIRPAEGGGFAVCGTAPLRDVAQALGVPLPTEEFDTFGGFVFDRYGHVPPDGSTFELTTDGLQISVTAVTEHRLMQATVRRAAADSTPPCAEK